MCRAPLSARPTAHLVPVLAMALAPLAAAAQDLRPADVPRWTARDDILGEAVIGALAAGPDADLEVMIGALRGPAVIADPGGDWACRTIKIGGMAPLTAYGNFRCRITEIAPGVWQLEKLTGSQRMIGTFTQGPDGLVYTGVGFVDGGPSQGYAAFPPDSQEPVYPGQTVPQVGYFEQMGPDRARLMLPDPILESDFDILYLTR